jgi:hypothetical protein
VTDEEKLEEKKEEGEKVETRSETVKEEKKEETEKKTEYKHSDYEYKSWSRGLPVPEGWERCPGYDVIRRLKVKPPEPADTPVKKEPTNTSYSDKKTKDDAWEPWSPYGGSYGGSCCRF